MLPEDFTLAQNYPNPFNPTTTIRFGVPDRGGKIVRVHLSIFNLEGRLVRSLLDEEKLAGWYAVKWDGRNETGEKVTSGLYFYSIVAGDFKATKKMLLTK